MALAASVLATVGTAVAAPPLDILRTDLAPLIGAAAASPTQFAVQIPHAVSTANAGAWSIANSRATWRYSVRIPTAVSLSFHAVHAKLPASAVLVVKGVRTTILYDGKTLHRSELWSRVQPGDILEFSLSVALADRASTLLELSSFQAGYRAIGAGVEDHPYYRRLLQAAGSTNASCVQNYECRVTALNGPPGQSTVGLIISNLYQCSGTLINDVPEDKVPYILTARHCETGQLGGGNPGAASSVTVFWDATTPCGSPLGSLYDPGTRAQTGASTVVEQQDAWLIRLDDSPVVSDAQLVGFDASGSPVQGGYTIHHALGYDKQFTGWYGTAFAIQDSGVLGVSYVSNFWETVNATGNIGPGTSGSGLFNQNNVLVGSASLGRQGADISGYESCPSPSPSPPNGSNGVADFTALGAIWNSTADTSSSTLPATLESILDSQATGTLIVGSTTAASMSFTASTYSLPVGTTVLLTWNAPGATACTAGGGATGDGWQGNLPAASSLQISETSARIVTYTLVCQLSGNGTVTSEVTITWGSPQPQLGFTGSVAVWTNAPATLTWVSNYSPCSISGGSLAAANLPSSGSLTTTQAATGDVLYQIQCGTGATYVTSSWRIGYVTPAVQFTANGTDRQLGQPLYLSLQTFAQSCTPSGGAPNDGWTSTAFSNPISGATFSPNVTSAGTYTYTLTCTAGTLSVQKSIAVTFENNLGYVTLSVSPTQVTFSNSPADTITLTWDSNLTQCIPASQPILGGFVSNDMAQDSATLAPSAPGTYAFTVTCNPYDTVVGSVTSAPVTVTVLPPTPAAATLTISPSTVAVGQSFSVTWSSISTINCNPAGGAPPDIAWTQLPSTSGSYSYSSQDVGQYTFEISCQSIVIGAPNATAKATVTITQAMPTATLSASSVAVQDGQSLTLKWSSTDATACVASGGGANGTPWSGNLAASGSVTQTATTDGSFTYTVTCANGNKSAKAQVAITVSADTSSSAGKSGGGGTISLLDLLALATACGFRWRKQRMFAGRH